MKRPSTRPLSKMSRHWKNGCSEKVRYETATAAKKAMDRLQEIHPLKKYIHYRCQHCSKFHVGTRS